LLALETKSYEATIRLGQTTTTDDAEGETTASSDASAVTDEAIGAAVAGLTGTLEQVPSAVSAIKVDGRRAYDRVRAGEQVELKARPVTVSRFELLAVRRLDEAIELDVVVVCSSGTYIRALAHLLSAGLRTGGHLTRLSRTRLGKYVVAGAADPYNLNAAVPLRPSNVAELAVGRIDVTAEQARVLGRDKRLAGIASLLDGANDAAVDPEGAFVGIA